MSDPITYVVTADIKAAVQGRETDVLDALGIDWRRARPHIDCPYPAHGGKDDWRWDAKKAKAFCTCQNGHADNVFNVVEKVESLDFDAAKLRVAEIIARQDLIKTKGGKGQKTDAASLLSIGVES